MNRNFKSHIHIMSLGHSGSTLLNLLLGSHPDFVSLGEVIPSFSEEVTKAGVTCSCGEPASACPLWGNVLTRVLSEQQAGQATDLKKGYEAVFEAFQTAYPTGQKQFVDSSKSIGAIELLKSTISPELKVIFLIRDVRSYAISHIDNLKRKFPDFKGKDVILKNPLVRNRFYFYLEWHYRNLRIRNFLDREKIPYLQVGYEELCLHPEMTLAQIFKFLNLPVSKAKSDLSSSESHIIRSNRMRSQTEKLKLSYDTRWLTRNEWILPAAILPGIMKFNAREVYSNISSDEAKKWSI